jgi:hypothetical protein
MAELGEKPFTSSANIIEGRAVGADICADHGGRLVNSAEQSGRVLLDRSYSADAALDLLVIPANSKSPQLCRHADQDVKCAEFVGNIKDNIRVRKGGYVLNVNGMPGAAAGGSGIARFARVCLCAPRHPSPLLSSRPCSCFLSLSAAGVWTGVEGQGAKLLKVTAVRTGEDGRTYADSLESLPLTPHTYYYYYYYIHIYMYVCMYVYVCIYIYIYQADANAAAKELAAAAHVCERMRTYADVCRNRRPQPQ